LVRHSFALPANAVDDRLVGGNASGLDRSAAQSADGTAAERLFFAASGYWPIFPFSPTWHCEGIEAGAAAGFVDFSAKRN